MSKYYLIKGDGFYVPTRKKVLTEEQAKELFIDEEIECLRSGMGDKEAMKTAMHYIEMALDSKIKEADIKYYLEDFGYILEEIDERTFYSLFSITCSSSEIEMRTSVNDRKKLIEFLRDIANGIEDKLVLNGEIEIKTEIKENK